MTLSIVISLISVAIVVLIVAKDVRQSRKKTIISLVVPSRLDFSSKLRAALDEAEVTYAESSQEGGKRFDVVLGTNHMKLAYRLGQISAAAELAERVANESSGEDDEFKSTFER